MFCPKLGISLMFSRTGPKWSLNNIWQYQKHLLPSSRNWMSDVSRLWSLSNSCLPGEEKIYLQYGVNLLSSEPWQRYVKVTAAALPVSLGFPACSSSFSFFLLSSAISSSNLAFHARKFSIVTTVPWNATYQAHTALHFHTILVRTFINHVYLNLTLRLTF